MIDPFTAFAVAQAAVKGIKSAIALGKDVQSIMGDIGKFYHAVDAVQVGANKARIAGIRKSDADISKEAFDLAWKAKQLWEDEKAIKSHLFLTGNKDVWENMMAERVRLGKERVELERLEEEKIQKDREALANLFLNICLFGATIAVIIPFGALVWQFTVVR